MSHASSFNLNSNWAALANRQREGQGERDADRERPREREREMGASEYLKVVFVCRTGLILLSPDFNLMMADLGENRPHSCIFYKQKLETMSVFLCEDFFCLFLFIFPAKETHNIKYFSSVVKASWATCDVLLCQTLVRYILYTGQQEYSHQLHILVNISEYNYLYLSTFHPWPNKP